ncbi:MAG: hypothetical protein MUF00_00720 [Gemmatimonadaceae bacterium]|jgi:hypothetical protein|nr:hypothetical protein [Gemmatimonadaceae bacterium]
MALRRRSVALATLLILSACARATHAPTLAADPVAQATLAQIYFWRARPGQLDAYTRYVREVAEPIDREAQRRGAFLSVATYLANDSTLPWTHMRVFLLRDSAQLAGLSAALSAAGERLQPDSVKRREQSAYSATLRDRVGGTVARLVH